MWWYFETKREELFSVFQCKRWKIETCTAKRDRIGEGVPAKKDGYMVVFHVQGWDMGWYTRRKGDNGFQYFSLWDGIWEVYPRKGMNAL